MTWPLADQTIQLHNLAVELALATMGAECVTNVVWIRVWTFQQIKKRSYLCTYMNGYRNIESKEVGPLTLSLAGKV